MTEITDLTLKLLWRFFITTNIFVILNHSIYAAVLSSDASHNCAVQTDNTVVCWGHNGQGRATPPSGLFSQVSVGNNHSCGIKIDNTVVCWGNLSQSPSGTFSQISAGGRLTCGIKTDDSVVCWQRKEEKEAPKDHFSQVSVGFAHVCGIRLDNNTLVCWGEDRKALGQILSVKDTLLPPKGAFSQVDVGSTYACGVQFDNTAVCWGIDPDSRAAPPTDYRYSQIIGSNTVDNYFSCGVKTDNTIVCFGPQDLSPFEGLNPPNSTCRCPYPGATLSRPTICACTTTLENTFSQIEVGQAHACGVKFDNSVTCWGYDRVGQAMAPFGLKVKSPDDPDACLLYGVHNDEKETQFFIINSGTTEVHIRGHILNENYRIEALDTQPFTNQLYAASNDNTRSKGHLYQVRNGAQDLTEFSEIDFREIRALAFHPKGTLWGWAQDAGLFQMENNENNEPDINTLEVILPYEQEADILNLELNDLTWNTAGTRLYGIGRFLNSDKSLNQENQLWVYNANGETVDTVCDNVIGSLAHQISALEILPNDLLLLSFTKDESLNLWELDTSTCKITTQKEIITDSYNVKGLAQPDCTYPYH